MTDAFLRVDNTNRWWLKDPRNDVRWYLFTSLIVSHTVVFGENITFCARIPPQSIREMTAGREARLSRGRGANDGETVIWLVLPRMSSLLHNGVRVCNRTKYNFHRPHLRREHTTLKQNRTNYLSINNKTIHWKLKWRPKSLSSYHRLIDTHFNINEFRFKLISSTFSIRRTNVKATA